MGGHIKGRKWKTGNVTHAEAVAAWNKFTRKKFAKDNYERCKNARTN